MITRSQDIKRWISEIKPQRMILLKSSADHSWPWSDACDEAEAERIFEATFPSLYRRMKRFESYQDPKKKKLRGLRHREDQGRFWWELRPCAYYDLFSKPKIVYQAIQFYARYSFASEEVYGNNKTYFLDSADLGLLCLLNSPLMWWFGWRHFIHMKDEALSNDQIKIAELPIAESFLNSGCVIPAATEIMELNRTAAASDRAIVDWLRHEFGIAPISTALARSLSE